MPTPRQGPVKNEVLSVEHENHCASSTIRGEGDTQKHASDNGPVIFTFRDELHDVEYEASLISITGTKMNDTRQDHACENESVTNRVKSELHSTEYESSYIGSTDRANEPRQNNVDVAGMAFSAYGSVTNRVKSEVYSSEYENSYIGSTDRVKEPRQNNVYITGTELMRVKSEPKDTNFETNHVSSTEETNYVLEKHYYDNGAGCIVGSSESVDTDHKASWVINPGHLTDAQGSQADQSAVAEQDNSRKQLCHVEVQTERMECKEIETQTVLTCGDLSNFSDQDLKSEIQLRKLLRKRALDNSISHTESSPNKMQKRGPGRPRKDQSEAPKSTTLAANTSSHQDKKLLPTEKPKRGPGRPRKDKGKDLRTIQYAADVVNIFSQQDKEASSGSILAVTNVAHTSDAGISVPMFGVAGETTNKTQEDLSGCDDADSGSESAVHKSEDVSNVTQLSHVPIIKRKINKINIKEKKKIAEDAKLYGIRPTAAKYHIGKSTVQNWVKVDFSSSVKRTKTGSLIGNRRPLTYSPQKDLMILSWIHSMREQKQHVTMKMLQSYATTVIQEENPNFRGSHGWVAMFFKRHGLILRDRRSQSQKLNKKLEEKTHREFPQSEKHTIKLGWSKEDQGQAPKISQQAEDAANISLQQDEEKSSILTVTSVAHTSGVNTPVPVPGVAGEIDNNTSSKDSSGSAVSDSVVDEANDTEDVKYVIQLPDIPVVRGKYKKMDMEKKFRIVEEAKLHGIRPTASKYSLTPSTLGSWMKIDFSATAMRTKNRSGRPLTYSPQKEVMILSWIHSMREQGQYVTLKMLQNYATSIIQDENSSFRGTTGWASWFLKRHGLALRNTKSQTKKPS